ncbi:uncharacterized protein HD556DRAFT_1368831, partial [Suillus plorans]
MRTSAEIEGDFNLLFSDSSRLLTLWHGRPTHWKLNIASPRSSLLGILTSSPSEHPSVKCRSSAYLFTPCYAANNGELETLRSSRKDVEELLQELDISGEERSQFFKSIADAFIQSGQPYGNCLSSHASYVSSSPSSSQSAAINAIALALCSPTSFDFDPLFKLDAVVSAKDHEAFSLLQVFLNSGLPELHSPLESHPAILEKYAADLSSVIVSLFSHIGHDLPYSEVASIQQIELSKVEKWAID